MLQDCLVPEDAILPDAAGLKGPLACLDRVIDLAPWLAARRAAAVMA